MEVLRQELLKLVAVCKDIVYHLDIYNKRIKKLEDRIDKLEE